MPVEWAAAVLVELMVVEMWLLGRLSEVDGTLTAVVDRIMAQDELC